MIKKGFLILAGLFLVSSFIKNVFEYQKNMKFYQTYQDEYTQEKNKNNHLKAQAIKTKDPFEVEKRIRDDLNLLKKDEVAVIIPLPTPMPTVLTPTPAPPYKQWLNVFMKG